MFKSRVPRKIIDCTYFSSKLSNTTTKEEQDEEKDYDTVAGHVLHHQNMAEIHNCSLCEISKYYKTIFQ